MKEQWTVLDDLRAGARKIREQGDSIQRITDAIKLTVIYRPKYDNIYTVHMGTKKFEDLFADQETFLSFTVAHGHPFKRTIIVEGVVFFCLLDAEELTESERKDYQCIIDAYKLDKGRK